MTLIVQRISGVPNAPAVYALLGGARTASYVAYVGVADNVRARLEQHFVHRNSSAVTGTSAVALVPGNVTEIRWWEDPSFADRVHLEAAEIVAFEVLEPVLRSRGHVQANARQLAREPETAARFAALFRGPATGRVVLPTLDAALDRIAELERRLDALERRVDGE